ncbi:MAG: hypothetical protein AAB731_04505 [Patescibacteria group bacterium]
MSVEKINIGGCDEDVPLGRVVMNEPPENKPSDSEIPDLPDDEPQIEEIVPNPPKEETPPPPPLDKEEIDKIWKKILPGGGKPN